MEATEIIPQLQTADQLRISVGKMLARFDKRMQDRPELAGLWILDVLEEPSGYFDEVAVADVAEHLRHIFAELAQRGYTPSQAVLGKAISSAMYCAEPSVVETVAETFGADAVMWRLAFDDFFEKFVGYAGLGYLTFIAADHLESMRRFYPRTGLGELNIDELPFVTTVAWQDAHIHQANLVHGNSDDLLPTEELLGIIGRDRTWLKERIRSLKIKIV